MLDEVNAQHALQPDGRAVVADFGVVRLDDLARRCSRHNNRHGLEKLVSARRLAVVLVARLVCCHRKGLLFYRHVAL